jgi:hypothetical protein
MRPFWIEFAPHCVGTELCEVHAAKKPSFLVGA